ncbi:hypothetical protein [Gimesia sp.]|uniref:hypothetical protein n=1 Tax=Gimesia sp. TaxID=2024833 RepID=UPI003A92C625
MPPQNTIPKKRTRAFTSPLIKDAIFKLSEEHDLKNKTDYPRTIDIKKQVCKLCSSYEGQWVASFAHYLFQSVFAMKANVEFSRVFEIPSLHSESHSQAGYDISVGPYDTDFRYRFMHKTVSKKWCDANWTWRSEKNNDIRHLKSLIGLTDDKLKMHKVYLVLNVFYCIHDWRRMGVDYLNKFVIPAYDSPLRTVIIDLNDLKDNYKTKNNNGIVVWRTPVKYQGNNNPKSHLNDIEKLENTKANFQGNTLNPISLKMLCDDMKKEWRAKGPWSKSLIK